MAISARNLKHTADDVKQLVFDFCCVFLAFHLKIKFEIFKKIPIFVQCMSHLSEWLHSQFWIGKLQYFPNKLDN